MKRSIYIDNKKDTEHFTGMTVVLAINYGGRDEILRGIKKLDKNNFDFSNITEKDLSYFSPENRHSGCDRNS